MYKAESVNTSIQDFRINWIISQNTSLKEVQNLIPTSRTQNF